MLPIAHFTFNDEFPSDRVIVESYFGRLVNYFERLATLKTMKIHKFKSSYNQFDGIKARVVSINFYVLRELLGFFRWHNFYE